jgi:hypothetical protein
MVRIFLKSPRPLMRYFFNHTEIWDSMKENKLQQTGRGKCKQLKDSECKITSLL